MSSATIARAAEPRVQPDPPVRVPCLAFVGGGGPVNLVSLGGDQVRHGGSGPDPRETPPRGLRTRDIYIPDLHIGSIKVKTRDFDSV
jgi:hypothetical protein